MYFSTTKGKLVKDLWCEKYRPKKMEDYVFQNDQQKQKFTTWLKEGSIPHCIFSGPAGTGKCLAGTETVQVILAPDTAIDPEILNSLLQYKISHYYVIPISNLFKILKIHDREYDEFITVDTPLLINSPSGYVPIRHYVKKFDQIVEVIFDNGRTIRCSKSHLVFNSGIPVKITDALSADFVDGNYNIVSIQYRGVETVYDVSLDYPHQYVTPNGLIHHNTSAAKMLVNELGVEDFDFMEINASRENSVDILRDKITNFVSTMPYGKFKVVLLDEADYTTPNFQAALRGAMEAYHESARFILTCNYPHKLIHPIHSRSQSICIDKLDVVDYTERVAKILINEHVDFDLDTLDVFVKANYPDLRKCINDVQAHSLNGSLELPTQASSLDSNYLLSAVTLIKQKKLREARMLICENFRPDETDSLFRWMYDNLELWSDTDEGKDRAIVIIRNSIVKSTQVADQEINISACLVELSMIDE